jgi:cell division transport system permease protein
MKVWRHLAFALSSAGQSFQRTAAVSLAAVCSITLILTLGGINLVLGHGLAQILDGYRQKVSVISINVADGTPLAAVDDFAARLRARPDVASVRFKTKDEVMAELAQDPRNQSLLRQLSGNPLPAQLEVKVTQLSAVKSIDALARGWSGADASQPDDYQGEFVNNVLRLSSWLTAAGLTLLGVLLLVSVVIVMNTIRTAVYHRRQEIEIMKLVGATEWFVGAPFVAEGVLTGLLAAALAAGVVLGSYRPGVARFRSDLFFVPLAYDPAFVTGLGLEILVAGIALGALGSYIGIWRYVRL